MESSGRAVFKTVPGFAFRATFEVDIEGFTPVKVMVATTVCISVKTLTISTSWECSEIVWKSKMR